MNKGLVHIYTGDGKGKTTASYGLAFRMAGYNKKVVIFHFLKYFESGEMIFANKFSNIKVFYDSKERGFFPFLKESEKIEVINESNKLFELAKECSKDADLIILDEIICAVNLNIIDEDKVLEFIKNRPFNLEVVLTGRGECKKLVDEADYVSEIKEIKHPYNKNQGAREGIEF